MATTNKVYLVFVAIPWETIEVKGIFSTAQKAMEEIIKDELSQHYHPFGRMKERMGCRYWEAKGKGLTSGNTLVVTEYTLDELDRHD